MSELACYGWIAGGMVFGWCVGVICMGYKMQDRELMYERTIRALRARIAYEMAQRGGGE